MMKRILLMAAMAYASIVASAATKAEADALYEKEKYTEAVAAYQEVMEENGVAYEIYYNLGNCYYKIEDIPHAVLCYERAYLMNPGDADLRANLALARGKTIDKAVPPSEMFFVTWWRELTHSVNLMAWSTLGILAFVLMLAGVALYMFVPALWVRKVGVYGAMAMLVVSAVSNLAALSQHSDLISRDAAIIMSPAVTVKSSPSDRSTDLFVIHEGSRVEILDGSMKDWMEVKFEEGKQGWIPASSVEVI